MPKRNQLFTVATTFGLAVLLATTHAQVGRGGSAWLTARGDAQRTSWIRSDALISVQAMSKPGFALQWKTTLENASRKNYGIGGGVSAPGVTLFVPMQLVTGSSNNVYAIDSDTGYLVWQRHFDATLPAPTDACPGGTLSAATRLVSAAPLTVAAEPQRGGAGRATQGYHSVLGQPGEGAPVEVRGGGPGRGGAAPAAGRGAAGPPNAAGGAPAGAPPAGQRADAAPGRGAGQGGFGRGPAEPIPGAPPEQVAGGGGLNHPSGVVYVISSDGVLHVMGLQSGKDLQKPAPFVPANSRWSDPIAVGTMLYTSTSGGCGGAPDAVWAIDLESPDKPVVSWKSAHPLIGSIAFTTDGRLVTVTSSAVNTMDAKTLQGGEALNVSDAEFVTGPTVIRDGDRELVAVGTKGGGISLVNTPPTTSTRRRSGAAVASLATWQDDTNAGWILVPTEHAVEAVRVGATGGPDWTASNLTAPATPIIVNGVVFVLEQGPAAVLHAYDGKTGKELWTSGKTMTAGAAPGSFWSAFGQIYVGTADGTLYTFGFNDERH
jgi:outer membrane protein assembly factor BamB